MPDLVPGPPTSTSWWSEVVPANEGSGHAVGALEHTAQPPRKVFKTHLQALNSPDDPSTSPLNPQTRDKKRYHRTRSFNSHLKTRSRPFEASSNQEHRYRCRESAQLLRKMVIPARTTISSGGNRYPREKNDFLWRKSLSPLRITVAITVISKGNSCSFREIFQLSGKLLK